MANKYSSLFDGPGYFEEPQEHLDAEDQFDTDGYYDAQDKPLVSPKPEKKHPGKRVYFKSLLHTGLENLSKATRKISDGRKPELKSAASASVPSTRNLSHWEYDRFDGRVPVSVYELLIDLDHGRHPEILELAIESKKRLTPFSEHDTFDYKVLNAMLMRIRDMRQNQEFDAIQSQTLEQLGRPYEYTRFE